MVGIDVGVTVGRDVGVVVGAGVLVAVALGAGVQAEKSRLASRKIINMRFIVRVLL